MERKTKVSIRTPMNNKDKESEQLFVREELRLQREADTQNYRLMLITKEC